MRVPALALAVCLVLAACGGASEPAAPTYADPQAAAAALGFGQAAVFDLLGETGSGA